MLRAFRFGLRGRLPPKLLEQRSALLLICSVHCCVGHVLHGQWTLLGADIPVLVDRSACVVALHLCFPHPVRASRSAHGFRRELHREAGTFPSLFLRDLDQFLDDLLLFLHSFSTHLVCSTSTALTTCCTYPSTPCSLVRCWTFSISSSQWDCVFRLQPVDQVCDRILHYCCSSLCKLGGLCREALQANVLDVVTTSNPFGSLVLSAGWVSLHTGVDSSCFGCCRTLCTFACFSTD